jgi:hypothetical protein
MRMWIARDERGSLASVHTEIPIHDDMGYFEDSPIEFELSNQRNLPFVQAFGLDTLQPGEFREINITVRAPQPSFDPIKLGC